MVPRLNREPGAGRAKLRLSRGFPRDPAKKRHPSQMVARITTSGRAKVWRVFSVLRCQWGAHCVRGKRLIIGGCHHMPRRREKPGSDGASPYLRRDFPRDHARKTSSLSHWGCHHMPRRREKPRLSGASPYLRRGFSRDHAKKRHPSQMVARITTSGRAKVWRVFFCFDIQWGCTRVRGKRLMIGGCHHMPRRCEKPRLRRSFALPEPGFPAEPRPKNVIPEGANLSPYLSRQGFPRGPALKMSSLRVHSCSRQTTDHGGCHHMPRRRGKPRLRTELRPT